VEIILLNKTCKYHKRFYHLLFCNILKDNRKNPFSFCWGRPCDSNFRVDLQEYVITAPLFWSQFSAFLRAPEWTPVPFSLRWHYFLYLDTSVLFVCLSLREESLLLARRCSFPLSSWVKALRHSLGEASTV